MCVFPYAFADRPEGPAIGDIGQDAGVSARQENVNPNRSSSARFRVGRVGEYVFVSKRVRQGASARSSSLSGRLMRWTTATSILLGFGFAAVTAAGHIATGNASAARSQPEKIWRASLTPVLGESGAERMQVRSTQYLFSPTTAFTVEAASIQEPEPVDPFDQVVEQAALSPEKLQDVFKRAKPAPVERQDAHEVPAAERFGSGAVTEHEDAAAIVLAYAARDEKPAAQALHTLAEEEARTSEELASRDADLEDVPVPTARPRIETRPARAEEEAEKPAVVDREADKPAVADKPAARERSRQARTVARRDEPAAGKRGGGLGWSFRSMFGGTRAGNGVAVYDISAAKVYMPDGSVLAAYSGIGKMANNPRYAHVRMNGPTPPHTYNLKMRERRFHGVEAIRMLPVDGKNKYGRDGFLAHSQLLRGRPGQSHGCVAFKDYDKFLTAFKKGKVRQMVVVSSGGRNAATRMASN